MTEKQAQSQGLEFTGEYANFTEKEKIKRRAREIRATGRRAVMVFIPGSRRDGYAIYAAPMEVDDSHGISGGEHDEVKQAIAQAIGLEEE